jgi:hypothetical protein
MDANAPGTGGGVVNPAQFNPDTSLMDDAVIAVAAKYSAPLQVPEPEDEELEALLESASHRHGTIEEPEL